MLISPPGIRFVSSEFYLDISKYPKLAQGELEGKELCVLLAQRCSAVALVQLYLNISKYPKLTQGELKGKELCLHGV